MASQLILSVFPGIDLLGRAFEEVWPEACVVRGPDIIFGSLHDIKRFHPPSGRFDGLIGGPPCQAFSDLVHLVRQRYGDEKVAENLIPEFERVVYEAQPAWFLMENVPNAPLPAVPGYAIADVLLNNRSFGGEQERGRRFSFGVLGDHAVSLLRYVEIELFEPIEWAPAVLASRGQQVIKMGSAGVMKKNGRERKPSGMYYRDSLRLQGLPDDFLDKTPFTSEGKQKVVGNGVPLPLGRAIAKAVKAALEHTP